MCEMSWKRRIGIACISALTHTVMLTMCVQVSKLQRRQYSRSDRREEYEPRARSSLTRTKSRSESSERKERRRDSPEPSRGRRRDRDDEIADLEAKLRALKEEPKETRLSQERDDRAPPRSMSRASRASF